MPQHDYILNNAAGAAFRADANSVLAAIVSNNSAATQPATRYAYQFWADTTTGILKQRNAANTAWISLMTMATGALIGNAATATLATTATTATNLSGGTVAATTITASSSILSAHSIGLSTGAGGTVTQLTSKGTTVTLNKSCGAITTASDALAAGDTISFLLLNTAISDGDVIICNAKGPGAGGIYTYFARASGATSSPSGRCTIVLKNETAGSLSDAVVISFVVIQAVTA